MTVLTPMDKATDSHGDVRIKRFHSEEQGVPIATKNLFSKLALFFSADNYSEDKMQHLALLPVLLRDMINRKLYASDDVLADLLKFIHVNSSPECSSQCRIFVASTITTFARRDILADCRTMRILAEIVLRCSGSFEDLLSTLCKREYFKRTGHKGSRPADFEIFEKCLTILSRQNTSSKVVIRSLEAPMSCGESPLAFALKFRSAAIVEILLKYGANVKTKWLRFQNAYEVLLCTPHHVFVGVEEQRKIKDCLCLLLRASDRAPIRTTSLHGCALDPCASDLFSLIPDDELADIIPRHMTADPCLLQQLCKLAIRSTLYENGRLPQGVSSLPLPEVLRRYVNLESDWPQGLLVYHG